MPMTCQAPNSIRDILENKIEFFPSPQRAYRKVREIFAAMNMQSFFRVQFGSLTFFCFSQGELLFSLLMFLYHFASEQLNFIFRYKCF